MTVAPLPPWLVVIAKPQREPHAYAQLLARNYRAFYPTCRVRRRPDRRRPNLPPWASAPLFPGYLFVAYGEDTDSWPIRELSGVSGVLERPDGSLAFIKDDEIEALKRRLVVAPIEVCEEETHHFEIGDEVTVAEGLFANIRGVVIMTAKERADVLLEYFGHRKPVRIAMRLLVATLQAGKIP